MAEELALWSIVVHALQDIQAGGDKASVSHTPQQGRAPTEEPGQGSSIVGEVGHAYLAP